MQGKLDPFHSQIVIQYFKSKEDFLNIIQVKKQFQFLLDRIRINPIKITNETRNLFQHLYTQEIFEKERRIKNEIRLENVKRIQYNYEMSYSEMKQIEETTPIDKDLKFMKVYYDYEDREKFGNTIPKEVSILGKCCFMGYEEMEIIIPSNIKVIDRKCFYNNSNIRKIIISDSVTKIESNAFESCSNLSSVVLSTNLLNCDHKIFASCVNLKDIQLPLNLEEIKSGCFKGCGIEKIVFPNSLKILNSNSFKDCTSLTKIDFGDVSELFRIEEGCFNGCSSLKSICIPSCVTFIEKDAFKDCKHLEELIVLNENCQIKDTFIDGCTSLTKIHIPRINGYCSYSPTDQEKQILERNGIKVFHSISNPIERNDLKSIEYIGSEILSNTQPNNFFTSLYIPSTITEIHRNSWTRYKNIKEIIFPQNIVVPNMIESFGNRIKIDYIKFTDGKTVVTDKVGLDLYKLFKKNGIKCDDVNIFVDEMSEFPTDCNISIFLWFDFSMKKPIEIPSNFTQLDSWSFLDKSITTLTIPSTVKKCSNLNNTFDHKHFPNLVELKCYKHHVSDYTLIDKLTNLTNIEIIDGSLDDVLVGYQYYLKMKQKGIVFKKVCLTFMDQMNQGYTIPLDIKYLYCYSSNKHSFDIVNQRKIEIMKFNDKCQENDFQIPSYQTKIYNFNFSDCSNLSTIKLNDGIKEIGEKAFSFCSMLESISIPSSVTLIGLKCFWKCFVLSSINYEGEIDGNCISECYSLKSIPVIKSLTKANFNQCSYLTTVKLNDSIEKIPNSCFDKCLSLNEINIPSNCSEIESFAFKYCVSLKSIHIPKSVKKINDGAFYGCLNLERIIIDNEDIEIGYDVFGECSSLKQNIIDNKKIDLYKFEVNYSQMKQFEQIGIKCNNLVIRKEDVEKYGIEIINDERVHRIHDNCFRNNQTPTELNIPTHITKLGMFSFSNCSNLTKLIIPSSIKEIPYCCFEHCSQLVDVELPETISLERKCFWKCHCLPDNLKQKIPTKFIEESEE